MEDFGVKKNITTISPAPRVDLVDLERGYEQNAADIVYNVLQSFIDYLDEHETPLVYDIFDTYIDYRNISIIHWTQPFYELTRGCWQLMAVEGSLHLLYFEYKVYTTLFFLVQHLSLGDSHYLYSRIERFRRGSCCNRTGLYIMEKWHDRGFEHVDGLLYCLSAIFHEYVIEYELLEESPLGYVFEGRNDRIDYISDHIIEAFYEFDYLERIIVTGNFLHLYKVINVQIHLTDSEELLRPFEIKEDARFLFEYVYEIADLSVGQIDCDTRRFKEGIVYRRLRVDLNWGLVGEPQGDHRYRSYATTPFRKRYYSAVTCECIRNKGNNFIPFEYMLELARTILFRGEWESRGQSHLSRFNFT